MEAYRKKVKAGLVQQIALVACMCVAILCVALFGGKAAIPDGMAGEPETVVSMQCGFLAGILAVMVFCMIDTVRALRSEERLTRRRIEETDERRRMIREKSGSKGMILGMLGLSLGAVVAGFFDWTVFVTLMAAAVFLSLVSVSLKVYYTRKY